MGDRVVQVECGGRRAGRVAFKVGRRRKDGIASQVDQTQFPSCLESLAGFKITNKNERQLSKIINKTFFSQIQSEFPPPRNLYQLGMQIVNLFMNQMDVMKRLETNKR